MAKMMKDGKYRIQVSLSESEYQKLRRMAFEKEVTVNELLRVVTVRAAEDWIVNG